MHLVQACITTSSGTTIDVESSVPVKAGRTTNTAGTFKNPIHDKGEQMTRAQQAVLEVMRADLKWVQTHPINDDSKYPLGLIEVHKAIVAEQEIRLAEYEYRQTIRGDASQGRDVKGQHTKEWYEKQFRTLLTPTGPMTKTKPRETHGLTHNFGVHD